MNSNNQKNINNVYKYSKDIPRELIIRIHKFTLNIRKEKKYGQRTIAREIKKKFRLDFSENTVSGWIHKNIVPFANEKTQFKPKPIPPKKNLYSLYIKKNVSASRIARKYKVSTIIAITWLRKYGIQPRTHTESMNTPNIKKELADLKLTKPTRNYQKLIPEKAYILGVLCGDGYIDKNFLKLEIRRDTDFIEEFIRCFEKVYGIEYSYYYYKRRNSYICNISSKIICKDLLSYGNFGTMNWRVPKNILNTNNKILKSYFLRGVYDSEGYVGKDRVEFTSSSNNAIKGISYLLKQLGIKHRIYKGSKYSVISIFKKEYRRIFNELVGFTIKRKMERLRWYLLRKKQTQMKKYSEY
ncbi:MAG: LAGLIDADG family homing endonuclease [Nanoarchaeota archaeon]|nr:LAGLIDADG family homing endonuclease [Nanoarchaeota archaeon]